MRPLLLKSLNILSLVIAFSCTHHPDVTSESSEFPMWQYLFDGKTDHGWRGAQSTHFPDSGWIIRDGILTVEAGGRGGDIITTGQYRDFELSLEFKLTPGANSGIKYFVQSGTSLGLEYQLLDDDRHPDAREGVDGNRTLGSLYDLIPAENKFVRPPGEWNRAKILVKGDLVQHWLNERKVVEYYRNNQMFRALLAKSKYRDIPDFGRHEQGHILLQDHGDIVYFREVRIRVFAPGE